MRGEKLNSCIDEMKSEIFSSRVLLWYYMFNVCNKVEDGILR